MVEATKISWSLQPSSKLPDIIKNSSTYMCNLTRKPGALPTLFVLCALSVAVLLWFSIGDESRSDGAPGVQISDHSAVWECEKVALIDTPSSGQDAEKGVVILTPISDAQHHLSRYFRNLCSLTYSHRQLSVVLGEDSSRDSTRGLATKYAAQLSRYFRRVEVIDLSSVSSHAPWPDVHARGVQLSRRRHLALSRNALLTAGLRAERWVLWLDVDVKEMPADIVERLIAVNKDVVVPSCMYHRPITGYPTVYDRNSWRETNESREFLKGKPKDFLMLEGYNTALRDYLYRLRQEGPVVELDGVGGCVLLIKAHCHRKGLVFPPFIYNHHIETEGLAKMAKDMGFGVYGIPKLFVFHQ